MYILAFRLNLATKLMTLNKLAVYNNLALVCCAKQFVKLIYFKEKTQNPILYKRSPSH